MNDKISKISGLMRSQLRISGRDLHVQYRRAGRLLPRTVRRDIRYLLDTAALGDNPKLARMINQDKISRAHHNTVAYLQGLDPKAQMWTRVLNVAASIALALIVVFVVILFVLVQRGFV
ncbi:hypothetical protein [Yoonia sp.]|uniref:hypothetical protein n=1 Tax=Yoonia sp. TaxID=2212373 RepID=UPI0019EB4F2D|nr:hypothetical protein [Yoonia sp.]MBE0414026.1 hypothetical protein [Yoonia sp.]